MNKVLAFLEANGIKYTLHQHQAVFTTEEAKVHTGDIPGLACKNILLRNRKKSRYFLLVLPADKVINIKLFGAVVGEKSLSFASREALMEKLGLTPGAVSPFGLINDFSHAVEVFLDENVFEAPVVTFHPNVNTATLELEKQMFHQYLDVLEQKITVLTFE